MANEMKELHGAVFELTPDMISAVSLDEIEVEDMTPKTRNVKDDTSDKRHRVDDERFGGTVYKLPGLAVRDCRRKRIRDHVSVFVRQRPTTAIPEMTQLKLTGHVLLSPLCRRRSWLHHRCRRRGSRRCWRQRRKARQ